MNMFTPPPVELAITGTPYAGFWIRAVAMLIDIVAIGFLNMVVIFVLGEGIAGLSGIVAPALYFILSHGGKWQATPGKRVMGIHLINEDGTALSYARAGGRYLAYIPSFLILYLGFVMAAFTSQKTALHDLIADTRVVYGKR